MTTLPLPLVKTLDVRKTGRGRIPTRRIAPIAIDGPRRRLATGRYVTRSAAYEMGHVTAMTSTPFVSGRHVGGDGNCFAKNASTLLSSEDGFSRVANATLHAALAAIVGPWVLLIEDQRRICVEDHDGFV